MAAATVQRPNILLITTDQQRFDALSIADPASGLRTPILDGLAAQGLWCRRAYATSPVCIPARRSLLTGQHPLSHGLTRYQDGLDWDPPFSLPGLLGRAGWHTALVGKLHLHPQRKRYGYDHMVRSENFLDRWDSPVQPVNDWVDWMQRQGIRHPYSLGVNGNGRLARPWDMEERFHHSSWLADEAVEFITDWRDPSQPYFLHLSFLAPHPPLVPPQAYWDRYIGERLRRPAIGGWTPRFDRIPPGIPDDSPTGPFGEREMHEATAGYFGMINHVDDRIRHVLSRMFEYGSPRAKEPTLIIFTSDHGEMLGDHHLWRKSLGYEGSARVPFIIAWRNLPFAPGVCDELVCLEDVVATVLDVCGQPIPEALRAEREGKSLLPWLRGEGRPGALRSHLSGICHANHFIVEGRWKYIYFHDTGEEQLFDLDADPQELRDRSGDAAALAPLRARLAPTVPGWDPGRLRPLAGRPPRSIWKDAAG